MNAVYAKCDLCGRWSGPLAQSVGPITYYPAPIGWTELRVTQAIGLTKKEKKTGFGDTKDVYAHFAVCPGCSKGLEIAASNKPAMRVAIRVTENMS